MVLVDECRSVANGSDRRRSLARARLVRVVARCLALSTMENRRFNLLWFFFDLRLRRLRYYDLVRVRPDVQAVVQVERERCGGVAPCKVRFVSPTVSLGYY